MKKTLKLVGGLAIGAIIGLILVFLLILIIDDREGLNNAMIKDVNALNLVMVAESFFLNTRLHRCFYCLNHWHSPWFQRTL